jgi:NAD(P)-dependent dehydrogenase (short-subunit alcohol dehydrogenase family)
MSQITLASFKSPLRALVFGANGGLGAAFVSLLRASPNVEICFASSRQASDDTMPLDLTDEAAIAAYAASLEANGPLNLVINASGLLHRGTFQPEKRLSQISTEAMLQSFAVNSIAPALINRYFVPLLPRTGKSVIAHLSARVGSISDNRLGGWYSYRAAKAAQNMITRTTAIEVARRYPEALIIGLHPGTVDTQLSKPFQSGVDEGRLFSSQDAAIRLLQVIDGLSAEDSGNVFAYDGQAVPF